MTSKSQGKSVVGGSLLVAGSCIGAAMLGMPVISGSTGFFPSLGALVFSWVFMLLSGLLLLEANLWVGKGSSLISITRQTLGSWAVYVCWFLYLFLFYSLMVAYASGSGQLLSSLATGILGYEVAPWMGSLGVIAIFSVLIYFGTNVVDHFNRWMMSGLVIAYCSLVAVAVFYVQGDYLARANWSVAPFVVPAMIISFGFHQLVPSLTIYYDANPVKIRACILWGTFLSFLVYLMWYCLVLGVVPYDGEHGLAKAFIQGKSATEVMKVAVDSTVLLSISQYFSLFAIITSFVGVALSFVDFLIDGLKLSRTPDRLVGVCFLVLVPPFILAVMYPSIFLRALGVAGGFGAVILYGVLPAMMVWSGRYFQGRQSSWKVWGGKAVLLFVLLCSVAIFFIEGIQEFVRA